MTREQLKATIAAIGISQIEFARLIDVTPRAVSLWMMGQRAIPGAVEAYVQLLQNLPPSVRQVELARLEERKSTMREGMYGLFFNSKTPTYLGVGAGVLVMENGRAYGADATGTKYDGDYVYDEPTGMAHLRVKLTFPPNVTSVFGVTNPYEWAVDIATMLDLGKDSGWVEVATPLGPKISVAYQYMRSMPET